MNKHELKQLWLTNNKHKDSNSYDMMVYMYRRKGVKGVCSAFTKAKNTKRHSSQEAHAYRIKMASGLWMLRLIAEGRYTERYYRHDYMKLLEGMETAEIKQMHNDIVQHFGLEGKSYFVKLIP